MESSTYQEHKERAHGGVTKSSGSSRMVKDRALNPKSTHV